MAAVLGVVYHFHGFCVRDIRNNGRLFRLFLTHLSHVVSHNLVSFFYVPWASFICGLGLIFLPMIPRGLRSWGREEPSFRDCVPFFLFSRICIVTLLIGEFNLFFSSLGSHM
ncbi:hypothetical protein F4815DRAFT_353283 [Daldinia loculata]|nr:hypothetical protein F4815DRAFT_353283 [Daldinia loculata]